MGSFHRYGNRGHYVQPCSDKASSGVETGIRDWDFLSTLSRAEDDETVIHDLDFLSALSKATDKEEEDVVA